MRQPGDLAYTHKRTDLAHNGFVVKTVELPVLMTGGLYQNLVFDGSANLAPVHCTRHQTLALALVIHPYLAEDYAAHPRVVTEPAKKGKVA